MALPSIRYSTDTRTIRPGDTYVAVRGELHDGHDFVSAAIEGGASAVVVDERALGAGLVVPAGVECTVVDDTVAHLCGLAHAKLAGTGAAVVAITGSVGKTTAKTAIVAVLRESFPVVCAEGNLNTPLGLSLMVLNVDIGPDTKVVMEMGARLPGDLAELTALFPPTVSVVVNVRGVHLETLGSIEAIEQEKGELVAALGPGGTAVLNSSDDRVRNMARRTEARIVLYGLAVDADVGPDAVTVELPMLGAHAVATATAAVAVGRAFGMDDELINRGLTQIVPERGRLARLRGRNDSVLIDDTYNASPESTFAALGVLADLPATRRVAFLGDMLELGPDEVAQHAEVLDRAVAVADRVIAVGPRMALALQRLRVDRPDDERLVGVHWFESSSDVVEALVRAELAGPGAGDVILVKGSQGIRMERVSEVLLHPELDAVETLARQTLAWKQK